VLAPYANDINENNLTSKMHDHDKLFMFQDHGLVGLDIRAASVQDI